MPFVVTITTKAPKGPFDSSVAVSRVAVATLEEAQEHAGGIAAEVMNEHRYEGGPHTSPMVEPYEWDSEDFDSEFPESGGTVGPLPDGTLIEVERTDWVRLAYDAGMRERVLASSQQLGEADKVLQPFPAHDEILNAFNARQSA